MNAVIKDDNIIAEFHAEAVDALETIENEIILLEGDPQYIDSIFRAIHTVKGNAGVLGLINIGTLSHTLETILEMIRNETFHPTGYIIDLLLEGVDHLKRLFKEITTSDGSDISVICTKLDTFLAGQVKPEVKKKIDPASSSYSRKSPQRDSNSKILIVEDDPVNRTLIEESIQALHQNIKIISVESGAEGLYYYLRNGFDLVFLDIMMPNVDGNIFISIVEENRKAGLLKHTSNIVVQTAIQSLDRLTILAQNECVQEIIRKPISPTRIQECIFRYCFEPSLNKS